MAKETAIAWAPLLILAAVAIGLMIFAKRRIRALPNLPAQLSGPADSITIAREKRYNAVYRNFQIIIDGVKVGEIGPGETRHFRVAPGSHTVEVKIDWCRSPPLSVAKNLDANLPLRCGTTHEGLGAIYTAFFKTRDYAYVRSDG
jgi:hypothetical protein